MKLVIDTHIWLWWVMRPQKHADIADHLDTFEDGDVGVSAASPWELVLKRSKGGDIGVTLTVPIRQWIDTALLAKEVVQLPITFDIAAAAPDLPAPVPADPADRWIVATAQLHGVPLLTRDVKLLAYDGVEHYRVPA